MEISDDPVVVIGAGPAGLMASIAAAGRGRKVILLDKNGSPGKKLSITGKGRCNITNSADPDEMMRNIPGNGKFLFSVFNLFSNRDLIAFLEERAGIPTVTERGGRIFPLSNDAKEVAAKLTALARGCGVELRMNAEAGSIRVIGDTVDAVVLKGGREIRCSSAVIATGGASYPGTGSSGDGYRIAESLGHSVIPPKPSLVPLISGTSWIRSVAGLSLKNIAVRLEDENGKAIYSDFGEMLFTHNGVSGPVILSASRHAIGRTGSNTTLAIDLKPALDLETLDRRILRDFDKFRNKAYKNALEDLLPRSMISVIVELSGIDPEKPVHSVTREERARLAALLKRLEISVTGTGGMNEAIVTAGGVRISEITPATMESKIVKGLYFAGEVIDTDAYTGGYNLTIAFCTGWCAGMHV